MSTSTDRLFSVPRSKISNFKFDENVAQVFDNMVQRSIPFYDEIHKIILDLAPRFLKDDGDIFLDLGCSTGTTICLLDQFFKNGPQFKYVGVDNSKAMLEKCQEKLLQYNVLNAVTYEMTLPEIPTLMANMIVMNYTLQFVNPLQRAGLLKKIFNSLNTGGVFLLAEKIKSEDSEVQDLTTDLYYDFKRRNGYSELEISQKREALEEVMIPITPHEQLKLLKEAGFTKSEMVFRWYNFACYLCLK